MQQWDSLTVSQLNQCIQQVIHAGFPMGLWVCGEIQGYDRSKTKRHIFFDLCEKDIETKAVMAKIGLVIFETRKGLLDKILQECGDPFELKDDIEVKFFCKVDFYPPHGTVRLIVESIDPSHTLGKIAAEKQRLIALLKKSGVLDKNKALPFPELPLRIGLVTSYESAAYNDFVSELRSSGFGFQIFYNNALMQGKNAQADIVRALKELYAVDESLDVIVITRGGGSIADLSCFDSQAIAEMIAQSPLPVLSGIGHEIDTTVTDLAAHAYQKTPTATARFLIACVERVLEILEQSADALVRRTETLFRNRKDSLRQSALLLQERSQLLLRDADRQLVRSEEFLLKRPLKLLVNARLLIDGDKDKIKMLAQQRFTEAKKFLDHCQRLVLMADPIQLCKRGFTISRGVDGQLIRKAAQLKAEDALVTHFFDGDVQSTIKKVNLRRDEDGGIEV
ncbi:MAG TPA: exodeoxyribonuclease VII large subunit [Candidatus Bathyarchaeia archaeon]|nr:exodeoxyribonuclease VII large subunit [Candidatus Bathyarchaeia archaeon]